MKSSHDRGLTVVHLTEGHTVTPAPGLPPEEEREYFWLQESYFEVGEKAFVWLLLASI